MDPPADSPGLRAVLVSARQATPENLQKYKSDNYNSVVLALNGGSQEATASEAQAARAILQSGFRLYYWIEIARNPQLADEHPEWMASLQGHPEWRRFHKDFPQPGPDEVVKNYPWVPVLYREAFNAHLSRVRKILNGKPQATGLLLNDLQGGPSACGCGNPLCRWTADYGPIKTATPLGNDAAAKFVTEVKKIVPESAVVPVWTTECEEHDGAKDGLCAGVGCFRGICWKSYTSQLMLVAEQAPQIAVLLPYKTFQRDLPIYGPRAGWITHALGTFQTMPSRHGGKAVPASRLIAVLQGYDVTQTELKAQIQRAESSDTRGYVVSLLKLEQGWEPKIVRKNRADK